MVWGVSNTKFITIGFFLFHLSLIPGDYIVFKDVTVILTVW